MSSFIIKCIIRISYFHDAAVLTMLDTVHKCCVKMWLYSHPQANGCHDKDRYFFLNFQNIFQYNDSHPKTGV